MRTFPTHPPPQVLERITKHHESVGGQISYEEYQELLAALTDASTVQEEIATRAELRQVQAQLATHPLLRHTLQEPGPVMPDFTSPWFGLCQNMQAQQELPNAKAALERSAANIYHNLQVGTAPQQLAQLSNLRRERREQFNREFERVRILYGHRGTCAGIGQPCRPSTCSAVRPWLVPAGLPTDHAMLPLPHLQHLAQQNERGADYVLDLPAHCLSETAGERLLVGAGIVAILLQLASAYTALSLSFRLPTKSA